VALMLIAMEYPKVCSHKDGGKEWHKAGYPVEKT
jgi:hypothetical protein